MTRTLIRSAAVAAAAVLGLSACGGTQTTGGTTTPSAAPTPTPSATAQPFEGTWLSEPISQQDATKTLKAAGLAKYTETFLEVNGEEEVPWVPADGTGAGNRVLLKLAAGQWTALLVEGDKDPINLDTGGGYVPAGDSLDYRNLVGQTTTFRWDVDGDALTLTWVSVESEKEYQGLPEGVIQRVLYTAEPFRRSTP